MRKRKVEHSCDAYDDEVDGDDYVILMMNDDDDHNDDA